MFSRARNRFRGSPGLFIRKNAAGNSRGVLIGHKTVWPVRYAFFSSDK